MWLAFDRRLILRFDWLLFLVVLIILGLGMLNLYSASFSLGVKGSFYKKQLIWLGFGFLLLFIGAFINYSRLEEMGYFFYFFVIILLILVDLQGKMVSGSRRWLSFGFFNIQPSEFIKLFLIVVLAKWFKKNFTPNGLGVTNLIFPTILILIPFGLIFLQPDLGTAIILLLIFLSLVFFIKIRFWCCFLFIIIALFVLPFSWKYLLKDYQKERIIHFLNPEADPLGRGYQTLQSKIAIGSGKLWGKGFLKGTQSHLNFIPEKYTDFVFSVFAEEWGFGGVLFLLLLYFFVLFRFIKISSHAKDSFGLILGYGISALFFWQIIINIGMTIGLLPIVGVSLPLFSYGGSSLIVSMFCVGVIINIHIQQYLF